MMKYIKLGNSNLEVSKICLGCMGIGVASEGMHSWTLSKQESKEIIKYALEQGINFFDTAMGYQNGTSEEFLGSAIKEFAKREDVVIATKFIARTSQEIERGISGKEHVKNCLEASLKRLDMEYVDLYILHMWDYHTPIEEILEGLDAMVKLGKVKYIGISNCYSYQIAMANEIAKAHGWSQFVSVQGHYNLIFREEEREMAKYCNEQNIAMTPYSALASGRLSKHPGEQSKRLQEDNFAKGKYNNSSKEDMMIINRVEELADKKGTSMTEIALAWLFTKVTSPVVGATKKSHLDGAVKAVDVVLSKQEISYLEELYKPHPLVGVMSTNK